MFNRSQRARDPRPEHGGFGPGGRDGRPRGGPPGTSCEDRYDEDRCDEDRDDEDRYDEDLERQRARR
jgi:hypothetical protein